MMTNRKATTKQTARRSKTDNKESRTPDHESMARILERISDAFVAFDAQMNYTYVNARGGELIGRKPEDLIGKNYWKEYPEAKGTPFADAYVRALETQTPIQFENYYAPWDRWFENRIYPSKDGLSIFFQDITDRKQAESLQSAIYQISEAANKADDMDELFRSVHAIIGQVMPARNFYIAFYDAENDLLSFPYYVDEADRFTSASIPAARPGRGMTEYVIRTGKALLSDAANFEELARQGEVELVGPPSPIWIGAPLIVEGRTIGAMAMQDYADPNVYTERELRMLEYVSGQVATAIERTRLYSDIRRRNQILSALQESTLLLMERRKLMDVLQAIVTQIVQLIDTPNGFIYLVEPDGKNLKLRVGLGANSSDSGLMLRLGEGLAGKIWKTGQPLVVQNYHQWVGRSRQFEKSEIRAIAGVPLTSGSQCIGVLGVSYMDASRTISHEDVELLMRFAQLASIALENTQSYQAAKDELNERIRAEVALVEAEAKYRELVERLPVVVYTSELGTAGAWHYVSPQIESLLGFTPEEWMTDPNLWYQQIHPGDRDLQEALEEQSYARGEPFEGEYRMFTRAGREIWIRDSAQILPPREGELPIVQGVLVDITERKQAEENLRTAEAKYRTLVEHISAITYIALLDDARTRVYVSPQIETLLGYTQAEYLTDANLWKKMLHPDDQERVLAEAARFYETGEPFVSDYRSVARDGQALWFHDEAVIVEDENSHTQFIQGVKIDITERKRAEENLRAAEARYRSLVEQLPGIVYTNPASDLSSTVYVSPQVKTFLGYTQEEWLEDPKFWRKVLHPEDHPRVLAEVERVNQSGELFDVEYRMIARDSLIVWFRDQAALLRDPNGNLLLRQGLMIDITDRKQAEDALKSSETRYRLATRATNDVIWDLDMVNDKHTWNENVQSLFGYTPDEAASDGEWWYKHIHSADHERVLSGLNAFYESSDTIWADEYRFLRRDGSVAYLTDRGYLERDVNGKPLRMIGAMSDITARRLAEDKIKRQVDYLKALRMIDTTITASADLHLSLQAILKQAISQLQVDAADVLLLNPTTHILEYADGVGFYTKGVERSSVRIGEGHAGRAVLERRMVSIHSLYESKESFTRRSLLEGENFSDYYGVPLIAKGEVKGVLEVFHRTHIHEDQEWIDFLEALAGQAGLAIDNATLFQNLQRSNLELGMAYESTLEGWSAALDLRDKETEGHTMRVTNLTLQLAEHMGLKDKDLMQIRRGALLHDIGKMGVPDRILLKPDTLTDEEWEIMQRHPVYAHKLLSSIEYLRPALGIPYCHHEKWNGSGYPRGLKGEEIPLEARIFTVVDVYDALVSDRPYRPAWTKEKALEYIKSLSGVDFDPRVVNGFLELLGQY